MTALSASTVVIDAENILLIQREDFKVWGLPVQIISRLCEEAGELASEVNHFEDTGAKRLKHGLPDKKALAKEVQDVIRTALSIVRYYGIEQELEDAIDQRYQTKIDEGYIVDTFLE